MVILARINHQLSESLGGLKNRLQKNKPGIVSKYLHPDLILFMEKNTREEAISSLVDAFAKKGLLEDKEAFYNAILQREKLVSTGIGVGIAIPHAKLPGYDTFFMAIGLEMGQGLEWNALDAAPVRAIFMIGGPDDQQMEYLKILSCLTMAIKKEEFRKKLFQATSKKEVMKLFEGY